VEAPISVELAELAAGSVPINAAAGKGTAQLQMAQSNMAMNLFMKILLRNLCQPSNPRSSRNPGKHLKVGPGFSHCSWAGKRVFVLSR